jgi:hypothetical protein
MPTHDPYLYAFMRACGAPSRYYRTYLKQLTPAHLRRWRKTPIVYERMDPTAPHPSRLEWVTPTILALSGTYLEDTTQIHTAERNVHIAEQRLLDAPTRLLQAGSKRTLLYAQARLLASLVRDWETNHRGHEQVVIPPGVPIAITEARLAAKRQKAIDRSVRNQRITRERQKRKARRTKRALVNLEWQELKEQWVLTREDYLRARMELRNARAAVTATRDMRRKTSAAQGKDTLARVPAQSPVLQRFKLAQQEFKHASERRAKIHLQWRRCKAQRRYINNLGEDNE